VIERVRPDVAEVGTVNLVIATSWVLTCTTWIAEAVRPSVVVTVSV
jgi:hypothetical protein